MSHARAAAFLALAPWMLLAGPDNLETLLGKPILEPDLPLFEAQVYTATRVPPLPPVQTAAEWRRYAARLRERVLNEVVFRGEAKSWRNAKTRVEWLETIPSDKGYRIRKLRFEALPGLWVPALLYEPAHLSGKVPVVLNVNGHEKEGKATDYIQERCINLAKKGVLALNPEWLGRGQLSTPGFQHYRQNQLDLCGTSGIAVMYLSLQRSLDLLLSLEHADPERAAVTGLSGGGWQTIFLSALDPRVRLANPVAGYSSYVTRSQFFELDLGDAEQTPSDLAAIADYTHLTAMMAPRPTLLTYNARDTCCFRAANSLAPLLQAARPFFQMFDAADRLGGHVNFDFGHNYGQDNREAFYRMLGRYFYHGSSEFNVSDIPSHDEVRTAAELHVPIPADNLDFHSLALQVSRSLSHAAAPNRDRLSRIVRAPRFSVEAKKVDEARQDNVEIMRWRLRMGNDWTIPAVEFSPVNPRSTVIVVADRGRSSLAAQVRRLLGQDKRVVALDPFYFGESAIAKRDWLFALLIAALGERPLGIQAGQVMATANWLATERHLGPVTLAATGPRSSLFAMIAAALDPASIGALEMRQDFSSLREILDQNLSADKTPELFCFGLLAEFDIPQLAALIAPRPLTRVPAL